MLMEYRNIAGGLCQLTKNDLSLSFLDKSRGSKVSDYQMKLLATHFFYLVIINATNTSILICVTLDPKIKETTQTTNQIKCEWALTHPLSVI